MTKICSFSRSMNCKLKDNFVIQEEFYFFLIKKVVMSSRTLILQNWLQVSPGLHLFPHLNMPDVKIPVLVSALEFNLGPWTKRKTRVFLLLNTIRSYAVIMILLILTREISKLMEFWKSSCKFIFKLNPIFFILVNIVCQVIIKCFIYYLFNYEFKL